MAGSSELVLVGVRQHRQEARTLDGGRELALEERARAGQARRRDLAVLADEVAQRVDVLVVDLGHAGDREAAEALAAEQQRLLVALGLAVLRKLTFTTWRGHISPLSIWFSRARSHETRCRVRCAGNRGSRQSRGCFRSPVPAGAA